MIFNKGDRIIYGNSGVCRVEDLVMRDPEGRGKERMFYILSPLYSDYTISVPVDNDKVFMRPVMSREEAEELIDLIPTIHADAYHNRVMRQLVEHYEECLKSHRGKDLLELTMSIYAKMQDVERQKRKVGSVDEKYMKRAEDLLYGELAVALDIPRERVQSYIAQRVEAMG